MEKTLNEALAKRWEMLECLMLLYMVGTGFRPDQLEMCEEMKDGHIRWFIRPLPNTKVNEEGKADPCHVLLSPL